MEELDRKVAEALGIKRKSNTVLSGDYVCAAGSDYWIEYFHPSTNWAQGGPLIEEHKINIVQASEITAWIQGTDLESEYVYHGKGKTPLIAAMKALVSKLGVVND